MAVTDSQTRTSKKSKHKKSAGSENVNKPKKRSVLSGSVHEEQDELETDSDTSTIIFPLHPKTILKLQTANGNISDSETDIDKPPKIAHKSTVGTRSEKSSNHSQSIVQEDAEENEDSDDSEGEPESMSLLQMHSAKLSPKRKSSHLGVNNSQRKSLPASGTTKGEVIRKPNIPEMSPSESEEDEEDDEDETPVTHSQTPCLTAAELQQKSISDEEEEEEEEEEEDEEEEKEEEEEEESEERHNQQQQHQQHRESINALDPSVAIKEEENSDYSSSCDVDDVQEFQGTSVWPSGEPSNDNFPFKTSPQKPSAIELDTKQLRDIVTFEQEHTRVSAPVIDIPHDSRVWILQVPRSIEAAHLRKQYLPKKLKGDEVLNLPSGRWQILEEPFEASKSSLNCIVSTGYLCYGMRWLQPKGFWFLKRIRTPIEMETAEEPWEEEVAPLPIKEMLKMKSNPAFSKVQHMKPSKKRVRNSRPDLPNKRFKEDVRTTNDESKHRKKKHQTGFSPNELSSVQGGEAEKGKKRKLSYDVNEVTPTKKKKKKDTSMVEDGQLEHLGTSFSNVNQTMNFTTEENISFSKKEKKKKKKHQESGNGSVKRFSFSDSDVTVKQEIIDNEYEGGDNSSPNKISESSKKQKRSHVKREEDHFMGTKQTDDRQTTEKEKKKKEKPRVERTEKPMKIEKMRDSQQNETSYEDTETHARKKKKHKHHHNRMEGEVSVQESEEDKATDISAKKKKKHKHKSSDRPKEKQEGFWERETTPDFLKNLNLTQATPEDV